MPDQLSTPTHPGEVFCFYPIEIPINNAEDAYLFIAVDAVSAFLFQTGMERANDMQAVLRNIQLLMEQDLFKQSKAASFTLVLHKCQPYRAQIEAIVSPHGGCVVFDDTYVAAIVTPPMRFLFEQMAKG
ncbi:hypothetical protein [Paraflavitalea speifideaquila]|uniref:hypothetical protein n=1 Tax=Paraflavitalea speifideaquila TaxID=3076558 RepID=UPI0028EA6A37|nr:hypothetical protein [Paraflavitalea speifideiaquila]